MAHAEIWFPHDQFSVKWATISPWVMWKSDFHMGHVEIWFLVISAIGDFTNFLKMYGNLSMAIAYTNSYRNINFLWVFVLLRTEIKKLPTLNVFTHLKYLLSFAKYAFEEFKTGFIILFSLSNNDFMAFVRLTKVICLRWTPNCLTSIHSFKNNSSMCKYWQR